MNKMLGEFKRPIHAEGVILPAEFSLENKTVQMLLLRENEWFSLQLCSKVEQETLDFLISEHIEIVLHEAVQIEENGYLKFPKIFLDKIKKDREVIVTGLFDRVEIMTIAELEALEKNIDELEEQFENLWDF